ncbi:hypothetical protein MKX01_025081 [Papaver californicum]|nr:hypothetical protein MKX01_025081 [Papaver californicum]
MACDILDIKPGWFGASGKTVEKMNLFTLQNNMKIDPEGYITELTLLYKHFDALLFFLFQQQSALSFSSNLGDMAMFLPHVTPYYPTHLSDYPCKLADLLRSSAKSLPSSLRCHLTEALILLANPKFKHKNETQNRPLQNVLFTMLQEEDKVKAKMALIVVCDLHRRRLWFDEITVNAICTACFHPPSKIMNAALKFLLGFENIEEAVEDGDADSSEDEKSPQAVLQREDVYKKIKQAKLQSAIHSMKRQRRANSERIHQITIHHKLFSRLQTCNDQFEARMMILKVIVRTVGLHCLILLNFYPCLHRYVQPHQRDTTDLLASAVQVCHDMVPPDAVEPSFRQVVNLFVHDKSRTEEIAVGLNAVREICLDLVLYRKSHEKAISTAARSLITFRCPTNPKARPKAFGEVNIASNISGLGQFDDGEVDSGEDEENDGGDSNSSMSVNDEGKATLSEEDNDETEESDVGVDDDNESDQSEEEEFDGEEEHRDDNEDEEQENSNKRKRKLSEYAGELNADKSHWALKRIVESTREIESSDLTDCISNEDFKWIKELKAMEGPKLALRQHGLSRKGREAKAPPAFKIPSSEELSLKLVNPSVLVANIRRKMTKQERLELVKLGKEDRGKYQARTQKEHKKNMPKVAKRAKIA